MKHKSHVFFSKPCTTLESRGVFQVLVSLMLESHFLLDVAPLITKIKFSSKKTLALSSEWCFPPSLQVPLMPKLFLLLELVHLTIESCFLLTLVSHSCSFSWVCAFVTKVMSYQIIEGMWQQDRVLSRLVIWHTSLFFFSFKIYFSWHWNSCILSELMHLTS